MGMKKRKERFEVSYNNNFHQEKCITDWKGKTVKSATVIHKNGDGCLKINFMDNTFIKYGYSDLGFWEEK